MVSFPPRLVNSFSVLLYCPAFSEFLRVLHPREGGIIGDDAIFIEVHDRAVHGDHAQVNIGRDNIGNKDRLVLPDKVSYCGCGNKDFKGQCSSFLADFWQKGLAYDSLQGVGHLHAHLLLLLR